jgi:hypothetical protein
VLEWVRRMELAGGVWCVVLGLALWNDGWWHWVLIGIGVAAITPWSGVARVLRKADRNPEVLHRDRTRSRRGGRRYVAVMAVGQPLMGGAIGYVLDGWPAAIFVAGLMAIASVLGIFLVRRRWRAEDAARDEERR